MNRVDLAAVKSVFEWAASRPGKRLLPSNPAREVRLNEPAEIVTRSPLFTREEMAAILGAASAVPDDDENPTLAYAKRWAPWIAAYTGARISEICQLRGVDVRRDGDVWIFDFTPSAGSIKTSEARVVPIHEHLLARGFVEFARKAGAGPLFYDPKRRKKREAAASQAEKRGGDVSTWVREATNLDLRLKPNHTWRIVFKSRAIEVGIDTRSSDWISGHLSRSRKRGAAAFYEVPTVDGLAAAMAKFPCYPVP
jgi:integrase